jgi:hypothetical protein
MNSQLEFDCVKDLPKSPLAGKVYFYIDYHIDLNNENMIKYAKNDIYEDVKSLVSNRDEFYNRLMVVETNNDPS